MGKYAYNMCEIRREYPMRYAEISRSKWQTSNLTNTRIARTGDHAGATASRDDSSEVRQ